MLTPVLTEAVTTALRGLGDSSPLRAAEPVRGGCVSQTVRLVTDQRVYLLKSSEKTPPGVYRCEAHGLGLLGQFGARVPAVLAVADAADHCPRFILQEWVDHRPLEDYWQLGRSLGEQLAAFHQTSTAAVVPGYGLDEDNFLGIDRQPNAWETDWASFYRDKRLRQALEISERQGFLPLEQRRQAERALDRLDEFLGGVRRQPVLLHGEIWKHNVLFDREGKLVFIDPAVYFGDREFDVASVGANDPEPEGFAEAYQANWPMEPGWEVRRDLYQLFWLFFYREGWWRKRRDDILRRYGS